MLLGTQIFPGQELGHYKIIRQIGAGGMGVVYLAQDKDLERRVALKVLAAEFTKDADLTARFRREALSISALNHPNVLTIYEVGQHENVNFIVSEYIDGETLRGRLVNGALPLEL